VRWPGPATVAVVSAVIAATTSGCDSGGERADPPTGGASVITVTSSAFGEGQPIPEKYSCDGDEVSPPLAWSGVPNEAAALALVVDDPDAPGGTYVHWVVANIDPSARSVGEGAVPAGGVQVANSAGNASYAGPCPPSGTHRYRFTVHALDRSVDIGDGESLDDAFTAVDDASVAQGTLTGTYERP
jgi:hypothetical protein